MQAFNIGQPVVCCGYVEMEYDEKNNRNAVLKATEQFNGVIVGRVIQPLGKYHSASYGYGVECDEGPYLAITGTMEFWQVKTGWRNRPLLVEDRLAKPCAVFKLPMQGKRPALLTVGFAEGANAA